MKPIRRGIRLYGLCDARTGYLITYVVHAGNYGSDEGSETFDKVWTLLDHANLFDQGYCK